VYFLNVAASHLAKKHIYSREIFVKLKAQLSEQYFEILIRLSTDYSPHLPKVLKVLVFHYVHPLLKQIYLGFVIRKIAFDLLLSVGVAQNESVLGCSIISQQIFSFILVDC